MKVLFISYFFEPYPGVGAKRTTYWAKNIARHNIEAHVITATKQETPSDFITYLPPEKKGGLLSKVIKDQGLNWSGTLKKHLSSIDNFDYDVVVYSGGPFMHFGTGKFIRNKFKAKVILDYRDPFGYNPRHKDAGLKKAVKTFFEKRFNRMADSVTTVNDICKADMSYPEKVTVIPNGFDDSFAGSGQGSETGTVNKGQLLNGGKLYFDFRLNPLLEVVESNKNLSLSQVGQENEAINQRDPERFSSEGFIAYSELLNRIEKAEICLVLTGGKAFETPTKTYDYIALNKKILVITEGEVKTGGIQSILEDYPNAEWANNNIDSINEAINRLQNRDTVAINTHKYSRAYSLEKLVALLKSL